MRTYAHADQESKYWGDYVDEEVYESEVPVEIVFQMEGEGDPPKPDEPAKKNPTPTLENPWHFQNNGIRGLSSGKDYKRLGGTGEDWRKHKVELYQQTTRKMGLNTLFFFPGFSLLKFKTFNDNSAVSHHGTGDGYTDYYNYDYLKDLSHWDEPASMHMFNRMYLSEDGKTWNDFSLRSYHYKKKIDPYYNFRLNGGLNEVSLNYTRKHFGTSGRLYADLSYGGGIGPMMSAYQLEGEGDENNPLDVYLEGGTVGFYRFIGVGGNIHAGSNISMVLFTDKTKRGIWGVEFYIGIEGQIHAHHVRKFTVVKINPEPGTNPILYDQPYNAWGGALVLSYGLRFGWASREQRGKKKER